MLRALISGILAIVSYLMYINDFGMITVLPVVLLVLSFIITGSDSDTTTH